ncbi:IclR family transcriptional regulator [Corticibacter populi]|uniref:IclR family transcriptional regulator n=1 Tax=Corticibacter populi TaxID=1550736 RepID=A0A3M6QM82_9BURK|nr:IclR family transcriptional regulator [Corticibacter populi]RMX04157.1 IclR family transcriptional regulator [Corticibacter populi]RZS33176.1 IclR family transcriptional regulator [Corticibacter populi]
MPLPSDPLFNLSLEKGLAVLAAFDGGHKSLSLGQIAERAGMSKASAQRSVHTLQVLGYVGKSDKTRQFHLLPKVVALGFNYLVGHPMIQLAQPYLAELSRASGETASLTEPCGLDMVYVSQFLTTQYVPVHTPVGMRIPMYCTSSGRAYLSRLGDEPVWGVLDASQIEPRTPATQTDRRKIFQLIQQARRHGYALNAEELFEGDMGVAAAITGAGGQVLGAVHVSPAVSRWSPEEAVARLAPLVMECARSISRSLTHF